MFNFILSNQLIIHLVLGNLNKYQPQQGLSISIYQYTRPLRPNRRGKIYDDYLSEC